MAKDGQICFHRRPFAKPVKPQRCTTELVKPLDGINKDMSGATLLLVTTSVYPEDCACFCPLLKTQHCYLYPNGSCNPPSASHPPQPHPTTQPPTHPPHHPLPHPTHSLTLLYMPLMRDITVTVIKVTQNPAVLAS